MIQVTGLLKTCVDFMEVAPCRHCWCRGRRSPEHCSSQIPLSGPGDWQGSLWTLGCLFCHCFPLYLKWALAFQLIVCNCCKRSLMPWLLAWLLHQEHCERWCCGAWGSQAPWWRWWGRGAGLGRGLPHHSYIGQGLCPLLRGCGCLSPGLPQGCRASAPSVRVWFGQQWLALGILATGVLSITAFITGRITWKNAKEFQRTILWAFWNQISGYSCCIAAGAAVPPPFKTPVATRFQCFVRLQEKEGCLCAGRNGVNKWGGFRCHSWNLSSEREAKS